MNNTITPYRLNINLKLKNDRRLLTVSSLKLTLFLSPVELFGLAPVFKALALMGLSLLVALESLEDFVSVAPLIEVLVTEGVTELHLGDVGGSL